MSQNGKVASRDKRYYLTSDEIEIKTQKHIVPNIPSFKGKTVVDVGCNTGFWLLQFYLHGAKKVIGIEPRMEIVDLFNDFANKNSLPCEMIQGFHPKLLELNEQIDCVSMMSVDEEIYDFDEYLYKVGCRHPNAVLLLQTMLIDDELPQPLATDDDHHTAPVKRFKGVIYKFEENNSNHRDGFDPHKPMLNEMGQQYNDDGEESTYIHTIYSKDYMIYILERHGFQVSNIEKINTKIKQPMTQSGKSGKLWWIRAQNLNTTIKQPINLFDYR